MSDGGKGSNPRPFSVPLEEYGSNYTLIYGQKKKYCTTCGKTFSWCQCEDNTGTSKNEYQDIVSTEDSVIDALKEIK